jgi:hypothetical protein
MIIDAARSIGRVGDAKLLLGSLSVIHTPPQPGFPVPDAGQKKFNSRLVAPTWSF